MKKDLCVLLSIYDAKKCPEDAEVISIADLRKIACSSKFLSYLFKYNSVNLLSQDIDTIPMPFMVACVCRLMTFGSCKWTDNAKTVKVSFFFLLSLFISFCKEYLLKRKFVKSIKNDLDLLNKKSVSKGSLNSKFNVSYVRTDLPSGLDAGGSVGHIAGVLNNIEKIAGCAPEFISSDYIPLLNDNIKTWLLRGSVPYSNIMGAIYIAYNHTVYKYICEHFLKAKPDVIYHRYALDSYAVAKYCLENNIPYILEYNGSELWILKHWTDKSQSSNISFPELSYGIEDLVLKKASLITCVSSPLKGQLLDAGIPENKILVNPNGVNEKIYYPEIDGSEIRKKYGISNDKIVIGFIGTFGAWHGSENLAKAYVELAKSNKNIHLLMIGDGIKMPLVKSILQDLPNDSYTLTGMVPQTEGAKHLAACDILTSPTIPNPDGTPFFGSPTKLFEYMAMGKAIVCSVMDQMAEIFENENTALLCKPGDVDELKNNIQRLVDDANLRKKLGDNARKEVCEKYTWTKHTEKIFNSYIKI